MKQFEIEIILDKEEISKDFKIICWKEVFIGNKRSAIKRAKKLQLEWHAEMYNVYELEESMDIELEVVELTKEEKERIELEEKLKSGDIRPYDTPVRYYLEQHNNFFLPQEAVDFIANELNIKTIGEFVDKYDSVIKSKLIARFPELNEPYTLERLDHLVTEAIEDVCEIQDLVIGIADD